MSLAQFSIINEPCGFPYLWVLGVLIVLIASSTHKFFSVTEPVLRRKVYCTYKIGAAYELFFLLLLCQLPFLLIFLVLINFEIPVDSAEIELGIKAIFAGGLSFVFKKGQIKLFKYVIIQVYIDPKKLERLLRAIEDKIDESIRNGHSNLGEPFEVIKRIKTNLEHYKCYRNLKGEYLERLAICDKMECIISTSRCYYSHNNFVKLISTQSHA